MTTDATAPRTVAQILADHAAWARGESTGKRLVWVELDRDQRADLTDAVLTGAVLTGAVLRRADLTDADLTGAVLTDAVLRRADLTGAVLTDADLTPIPVIPNLAGRVLEQIEQHPETHDQTQWHSSCGTKHCAAGWTVQLAGDVGKLLEYYTSTSTAALLLLRAAHGDIKGAAPFGGGDDPLPWLRELAARKPEAEEPAK